MPPVLHGLLVSALLESVQQSLLLQFTQSRVAWHDASLCLVLMQGDHVVGCLGVGNCPTAGLNSTKLQAGTRHKQHPRVAVQCRTPLCSCLDAFYTTWSGHAEALAAEA